VGGSGTSYYDIMYGSVMVQDPGIEQEKDRPLIKRKTGFD
jgi:hypothetical protein